MRINPVVSFTNNFIRPAKRSIAPASNYDSVSFASLKSDTISFGSSLPDKIAPPTFENETLNAIIQRNTDIMTINTKDAVSRGENNTVLASWFNDDGLEMMRTDEAYPMMVEEMNNLIHDGASFGERDRYYAMAVQRLIDNGAIDAQTFVLIDTGHSVPIAAQLMKEENRIALGDVKGTFLFGESVFPKIHPRTGKDEKAAKIYEEQIRDESNSRISSQILDFGDIIKNANENATGETGALFIGVDSHRCAKLDPLKLPTVAELKKLGLNKVAIVQEMPPMSSFSQSDADRLFPFSLTSEKIQRSLSYMREACEEAQQTPGGAKISKASQAAIKELLTKASDALKPNRGIERAYSRLDTPDRKQTAKLISKREFGYGTKMACGSDINEYLKKLKKDSNNEIQIFIEGASLLKLRDCSVERLRQIKNDILAGRNRSFEYTIQGNFSKAFEDE